MKEFAGKVVVVTGSAGGIGRALVERFTDEGMRAVVADIDAKQVEDTTAALRDDGRDVIGVVTDVTELSSLEALRDKTLEAFGAVDVLCNNAGVGSASEGQMWEHHVNDWRWSLDVNVMGAVNGINAFLPTMLAQDTEGAVVNTTSGNGGFTPMIHSAVYATTKAALTCLTECLWGQLRELDAKITAHLLYPSTRTPGMLKTGIWQPGRNRHARYDRPGAPPAETGRDQLTPMLERPRPRARNSRGRRCRRWPTCASKASATTCSGCRTRPARSPHPARRPRRWCAHSRRSTAASRRT